MTVPERWRIVVIEDDDDTRANLRDILELDDYEVEGFATLAEAVDQVDWPRVLAVILDRKLPDADAAEALPRLAGLAPKAAILIATGYPDLEGALACLRQGAADYILKPIRAEALLASLAKVVDRHRLAAARENAEQRALQAERLAAIGQMMTGLAHESRNALQRSQACLEMLALEVEDRPEALELVGRIQRAQDHLHRLYEEVRSYAAPIVLARCACRVEEVWREAWACLSHVRQDKELRLVERIDWADLPVEGDAFALGQVLRNILDNAIAVSPPGGAIEIRASDVSHEGVPAVEIRIRDHGPGLTADQRARIFEPFFTTKTKGTGLGMAIARRIVDAHGGAIRVGEGHGPGAEIVLTLPRRCANTPGAPPPFGVGDQALSATDAKRS
jgi:signal transduction histidine kinase